jgi:hypothetical protein
MLSFVKPRPPKWPASIAARCSCELELERLKRYLNRSFGGYCKWDLRGEEGEIYKPEHSRSGRAATRAHHMRYLLRPSLGKELPHALHQASSRRSSIPPLGRGRESSTLIREGELTGELTAGIG